jgi:hypoxanthine phosphoribosyltransferase
MRNCKICRTPCVAEYRRQQNAGTSSYCFMEALDYKRKLKRLEIKETLKSMKEFISAATIDETIQVLADSINADYDSVHLVGLLKGSFVFMADLMRKLTIPVTIDFMSVTSYAGTESTGEVKILKELNESIYNKDVLIVEDIVDTGLTLRSILDLLLVKHPKSLNVVTLLDKPGKRTTPVTARYVGIEIEDKFVVGYGIDYDQAYRQLPYIGTVPI